MNTDNPRECYWCGAKFKLYSNAAAHETSCPGKPRERTRPAPVAHHYFTPSDPELRIDRPRLHTYQQDRAIPVPKEHRGENW